MSQFGAELQALCLEKSDTIINGIGMVIPMVRIEVRLNAPKYREVLGEYLIQSAHNPRIGRKFTFQHNNSTHTTKTALVCVWHKPLNVCEWPSQSSDLIPIEHL